MKVVWANEPPITTSIIMQQLGNEKEWKAQTVIAFCPAKNKQVINVKSLESGKFIYVDGPYTFEEGDVIQYNALAAGDNKKVTITFVGEDTKASDCK